AWLTGRSLLSLTVAGPFPALLDLTPNWHVLGFTMTMAVAAAILFSVFPAFQLTSAGPAAVRLESTRATRRQKRVLPYLVIGQVALTLVLLIAANLFVRTFRNLQTLDAGFNREGVFLVELEGRRTAVSEELVSLLQSVPGVASVSISTHTPLSGALWTEPAGPTGQPLPQRDSAIFVAVGPRFFATMQTALLAGREFTSADSAGAPLVAIVD